MCLASRSALSSVFIDDARKHWLVSIFEHFASAEMVDSFFAIVLMPICEFSNHGDFIYLFKYFTRVPIQQ